jgi:hypothetical protein
LGTGGEQRWPRRPFASALILVAVFVAPIVAGVGAGRAIAAMLPPPSVASETVMWWVLVLGGATTALVIVDRLARRALPLAWLLRMTFLFPTKPPRRWNIARRVGTVRQLEEQLDAARTAGVHDDATDAATRIVTLITALQTHDRHTRGHAERVRVYTDMLTAEMGLEERDRERIRWAALLHDIGKLAVSEQLLNKPDKLDEEEWRSVSLHPEHGARFCGPLLDWLAPWGDTVIQHHERFDGRGYPAGLAGESISLGARIVAVPDAYEVMTAPRPYKKVMGVRAARAELAANAGSQFDPAIVRAFLNLSVRRLQWVSGPAAWLAQVPFFSAAPKLNPSKASVGVAVAAALALTTGMGGPAKPGPSVVKVVTAGAQDDAKPAPRAHPSEVEVAAAPRLRAPDQPHRRPRTGTVGPVVIILLPPDPPSVEPAVPEPGVDEEPPVEPVPPDPTPSPQPDPEPDPEPTVIASPDPVPTQEPTHEPTPDPTTPPIVAAAPVADAATTTPGGSVLIPVLANDGGDLDVSTLAIVSQPQHGAATVVEAAVLYVAQNGWTDVTDFTYQVCSVAGDCSLATVTVTIVPGPKPHGAAP